MISFIISYLIFHYSFLFFHQRLFSNSHLILFSSSEFNILYIRVRSMITKTTDTTEEETVYPLRYYYTELSFCAVMLSLFRPFGENENQNEGENDDEENNGILDKSDGHKNRYSNGKFTSLLLFVLLIYSTVHL